MKTAELIDMHGVDVLAHLDREVDIPVLTGVQRQGDVLVVPTRSGGATTVVPCQGVPVVRGESGGNTHLILAEGPVMCDVCSPKADELKVAMLTVPPGSTAWLTHPEHGYAGIGPGVYEIRRQREQADVIRLVAD